MKKQKKQKTTVKLSRKKVVRQRNTLMVPFRKKNQIRIIVFFSGSPMNDFVRNKRVNLIEN